MSDKVPLSREELALALTKIISQKEQSLTKELIVETFNYIYDNLGVPTEYVTIVNDIHRTND